MKNVKKIILVAMALLMMLSATTLVSARIVRHIDLCEKDPATWIPIPGGAWATLDVNQQHHIEFKGHGLIPYEKYVLVAYNESWPNVKIIGRDDADRYGFVYIGGKMPKLPVYTYTTGEYAGQKGAKIWLVHNHDLTGNVLSWAPQGWLWETKLYKNF